MEARERELKDMIERKEKSIELRLAGEDGKKAKAARERKSSSRRNTTEKSRSSIRRSRSASIQRDTSRKTQVDTSRRRVESQSFGGQLRDLLEAANQSESSRNQSDQARSDRARRLESRSSDRGTPDRELSDKQSSGQWKASRTYGGQGSSKSQADTSKTIGRVIRTVVILYVIFGLFAGIMPRIVGNLGEFVTDLRDEFTQPEPEPGYEVVTEEAVVAVDRPIVRTDSVDFILKVDIFMENLDEAQAYLAYEYSPDAGLEGLEDRFNRLVEEKAELDSSVTPPSALDSYWEFFMLEYEWTLSMMEKTINGESADGDYERLNLLQYDKFAELVRLWNQEGVAYDVAFRQYDYVLIPVID
jgi:hypothetical protein